ncbi:lectin C-type domain protein [Necator americanus]|uniref:Lectin C-type domain protein n=1 Tax=Necator americanus TaxID=51031 RepID=W2TJ33_NECAM|nr:lectin C-type domain protein [Necator americanus]ETN81176.1 lectin C-type domain protein [Necator americanus]
MKSLLFLLLPMLVFSLPAGSNSDNANCDSDWTYFDLTKSCYYVGSDNTFDSAEADCKSLGGHLTSIVNAFENNFVASLTEVGQKQDTNGMTWIGLRYQQNKWTWMDGSDSSYLNWMKGKPEKDASKYACAEILQDDYKGAKTQWNDVDCGVRMRKYVCKKPAVN